MRYLRIIVAAVLLLTLEFTASAQVSGYMGKRFVFSGNALMQPQFGKIISDVGVPNHYDLTQKLSTRPELEVEFVASETQSVVIRAEQGSRIGSIDCSDHKIGIRTLTLEYRSYFNNMAPLGPYWGCGLTCSEMDLAGINYLLPNSLLRFGAITEWGRRYIYFDYLAIDFGIQYGITFANPFDEKPFSFEYYTEDVVLRHEANKNLWMHSLLLFKVGVGVIPF